jgi:hypothetical protein
MHNFLYASDAAMAAEFEKVTGVTVTVRRTSAGSRRVKFSDAAREYGYAAAIARIERAIERAKARDWCAEAAQ